MRVLRHRNERDHARLVGRQHADAVLDDAFPRLDRLLGGRDVDRGDRIAVVFGEGQIVAETLQPALPFFGPVLFSGPVVAQNLRDAAEDRNVKAIVFRVNSPGGSAVGSDVVRREVIRAIARVTIMPMGSGSRRFDPDLIRVDWLQ